MTRDMTLCSGTEMEIARDWFERHLCERDLSPISFTYCGVPSKSLEKSLKVEVELHETDTATRCVKRISELVSGLVLRIDAILYKDFPVVEWVACAGCEGREKTPILENLLAIDARFTRPGDCEFVLHHQKGSRNEPNDYECYDERLRAGARRSFSPVGGRSSNNAFPYYCLQWGRSGINLAIGWPGQWHSSFERDGGNGIGVKVGQEKLYCSLLPGEEIRTPRMVLQFFDSPLPGAQGEWRAKNIFRRWMRAHNMPKVHGRPPEQNLAACSSHQYAEMINANEENQKEFIRRYAEEKLGLNYWWMDAGWYPCDGNWMHTGSWEPDKQRFPNGLRPISDYGRSLGMGTILWFEPERVDEGTELFNEHPEWMLAPPRNPGGMDFSPRHRLFNFGIPEACDWMIERVDGLIISEGVDFYRQDFNQDPLLFWRCNEPYDRQGINENHYVTGLLRYWDALRERHPDMLLDSCASGGRRNDIDVMKRAIPLIRSDTLFHPVEQQAHFMGASGWLPFHGTGTIFGHSDLSDVSETVRRIDSFSLYDFRSHMSPHMTACWDLRDRSIDYETLRRALSQWRRVVPYYAGDFYPLTHYSLDNTLWAAWQFDRPELLGGVVQVFRREDSAYTRSVYRLCGLVPDAQYEISDLDSGGRRTVSGAELMEKGIEITLERPLDTALLVYNKQ